MNKIKYIRKKLKNKIWVEDRISKYEYDLEQIIDSAYVGEPIAVTKIFDEIKRRLKRRIDFLKKYK